MVLTKISCLCIGTVVVGSSGALVSYLVKNNKPEPYKVPEKYLKQYKPAEENFWGNLIERPEGNSKNNFFKF